jgi:hypothetical protein
MSRTSDVDAAVQTFDLYAPPSAATPQAISRKPPLLKGMHRAAWPRRRTAAAPALSRRRLIDKFVETPTASINQLIFENVVHCINPVCPPRCCTLHSALGFLREHCRFMLGNMPCQNLENEQHLQCTKCYCLQQCDDLDDFVCDVCEGSEGMAEDTSGASARTSGAHPDDEDFTSQASLDSEDLLLSSIAVG